MEGPELIIEIHLGQGKMGKWKKKLLLNVFFCPLIVVFGME